MKKCITKYLISICLLCSIAHHSAYEYSEGENRMPYLFDSLRRTDQSEATYHFREVNKYEPVTKPILYEEQYGDSSKIIVGFNNMVVFGELKNDHHFVVTVNEGLNEDVNIPSYFLDTNDSGELFEVISLKPTTTTTTTTPFPTLADAIKKIQKETLPGLDGFDPDTQTFSEYLMQVGSNFSRMAQSVREQ